ncbi:MAG: hypothetical protein COA99_17645 [Moraxellaceae bacterium]|nr:MAG: hypothetical protein COA99_17645 [Moraxellaceae bacterium]
MIRIIFLVMIFITVSPAHSDNGVPNKEIKKKPKINIAYVIAGALIGAATIPYVLVDLSNCNDGVECFTPYLLGIPLGTLGGGYLGYRFSKELNSEAFTYQYKF